MWAGWIALGLREKANMSYSALFPHVPFCSSRRRCFQKEFGSCRYVVAVVASSRAMTVSCVVSAQRTYRFDARENDAIVAVPVVVGLRASVMGFSLLLPLHDTRCCLSRLWHPCSVLLFSCFALRGDWDLTGKLWQILPDGHDSSLRIVACMIPATGLQKTHFFDWRFTSLWW